MGKHQQDLVAVYGYIRIHHYNQKNHKILPNDIIKVIQQFGRPIILPEINAAELCGFMHGSPINIFDEQNNYNWI